MTTAWLRDLEEKVQEASERLGDLRSENDKLQKQVDKLQNRGDKLQNRGDKLQNRVTELEAQLESAPDAEDLAGWSEERDDIRQRVEKLADHLGQLLEN